MNVSVVGTGHVGLTTAACLAHMGHQVVGADDDQERVRGLQRGEVPFHEPGLAELVDETLAAGSLRITGDTPEAVGHGDVVFVSVGTPTEPSGRADLRQVHRVAETIARSLDGYTVVAEKSTVPVGTGDEIRRAIEEATPDGAEFDVVSNPEFLQEGRAIEDTLEPDRIVLGTSSERAEALMRRLYEPILERTGCPFVVTDLATAELVKHSSNAFLATKISFINQVAEICERTGADVETVASAMGLDPRIGPSFLRAGIGYGGACFPKDVKAFHHAAEELGIDFGLLEAVDRINAERARTFSGKIESALGGLEGKRIAMWGLAFKPGTDDLRNAPAISIARDLLAGGASVSAYDPAAMAGAKELLPAVSFEADPYEAARGADCLVICTEWSEFAAADLTRLREALAKPLIVDGRNMFEPAEMAGAGFTYVSMGRPAAG
ncbi:MAG: UDP-glucose/GDP-mannose dehydrogenase family protein [Actinomycetota bacterium]